jgi:hypothetical protein
MAASDAFWPVAAVVIPRTMIEAVIAFLYCMLNLFVYHKDKTKINLIPSLGYLSWTLYEMQQQTTMSGCYSDVELKGGGVLILCLPKKNSCQVP